MGTPISQNPLQHLADVKRRLGSLDAERTSFVSDNAGVIDTISRTLSVADVYLEDFDFKSSQCSDIIHRAEDLLRKDPAKAARFLDVADKCLNRLEGSWMMYHDGIQGGATAGMWTAGVVAVSAACIIGGYYLLGGLAGAIGGGAAPGLTAGLLLFLRTRLPDKDFQELLKYAPELKGQKQDEEYEDELFSRTCTYPKWLQVDPMPTCEIPQPKPKISKHEERERKALAQIRALIQPTAEKPKPPADTSGLVNWAMRRLDAYKLTQQALTPEVESLLGYKPGEGLREFQAYLDPELGSQFIEQEAAASKQDDPKKFVRVWQDNLTTYLRAANADDLIISLFHDYLTNYTRDNAQMIDFMRPAGGNCEAETKLITSAFAGTQTKLPPGWRFGVQSFTDHLQAVAYNDNTHEVWNLLTGEKTTEIRAPIYHPYYLLDGYVTAQGKQSPVELADLKIADPNVPFDDSAVAQGFNTNSKLRLRGGVGVFSNGPVPEHAFIGPPGSGTNYVINGYGNTDWRGADAIALGNVPEEKRRDCGRTSYRKTMLDKMGFAFEPYIGIVFKSPEEVSYFAHLNQNEKVQYVLQKVSSAISRALANSEDLVNFFKNPQSVISVSSDRMEQWMTTLTFLDDLFSWQREVLDRIQGRDDAELQRLHSLEQSVPKLAELRKAISGYYGKIKQHPLALILIASKLPHNKRVLFLDITKRDRYFHYVGDLDSNVNYYGIVDTMSHTLSNRTLIGIGKPPDEEKDDSATNEILGRMRVTLVPFDRTLLQSGQPAEVTTDKGARTPLTQKTTVEPIAAHYISAEAMIDLLLSVGASRWSPQLSAEFKRLNRDGRYDALFKSSYSQLAQGYPEAQRTVLDPIRERERAMYKKKFEGMQGMEGHMLHEEMMMGKYEERRVPPDIAQILQEILQRDDAKEASRQDSLSPASK